MSLRTRWRDCLVCGVKDAHIQKRLLGESELTFEKAFAVAMGFEAATRVPKGWWRLSRTGIKRQKMCMPWQSGLPTRGQVSIFGVGERTIQEVSVSTCFNCSKKGHIQRTCRQPRKAERVQGRAVRHLTEDSGDEEVQGGEEPPKYTLQQILSTVIHKPIQVEVSIDGQGITMELDTGAAVSLVSEITYKRMWPKQVLTRSTATLTTYSGEVLKVIGKYNIMLE